MPHRTAKISPGVRARKPARRNLTGQGSLRPPARGKGTAAVVLELLAPSRVGEYLWAMTKFDTTVDFFLCRYVIVLHQFNFVLTESGRNNPNQGQGVRRQQTASRLYIDRTASIDPPTTEELSRIYSYFLMSNICKYT